MKLLLVAINAKYIHSNLAVYNLRAYAGEYRRFVELSEFTINNRREYILQEIYKKRPDVLCFSCYIWNYDYVRSLAEDFHKLRPEVPIWVGGPEVSYEVEEMFCENPAFFGVMIGEGEATFRELAAHYCGEGRPLAQIAGIAFRDGEHGVRYTEPREPLDMNEIPFCYEDMEDFENRIVYYESSRGCPFSCSYCLSSIDKTLRFRSLVLVKRELSFFLEKEVPQVKFVDRTFNCRPEHAMEIWSFLRDNDRGITNFHFEIAADLLTEEELRLLSALRPGLVQLEIGVQSTNLRTIREIRRVMQLSRVESAVRLIQRAGNIHEHLDLIAGLPYEGYERFAQSFREIYALKPNQLQLGFLKVLKGSYLYEHREEYGILFGSRPPYEVLATKWLSYEEVLQIKLVEEMLEVYYNSGQFEMTLKLLDAVREDSFAFFLELGQFYETRGYRDRSHSRIRRCEILLEFLEEEPGFPSELAREALIYDLYSRENCKSRPSWAVSPSEFSDITRAVCRNGKLSHIEPFHYHFPAKNEKTVHSLPNRLTEEIYVLFEYEKRDVLDHQAKTTELIGKEIEKLCGQQN